MRELGPDDLLDYLRDTGRLPADATATVRVLEWGVSNMVLRVDVAGGESLVVKQSRERLRTQADWFSRLDRIHRETDVMRTLQPLLPPQSIPAVLFEDRDDYLYGMEAVAAEHRVWKSDLLAGRCDLAVAGTLGELLAAIHAETAARPELAGPFRDRTVFDELRIDPYYRRVRDAHPDLRAPLDRLIDATLRTGVCLVHADFSPKNVLIVGDRATLVDFETGHWGDPAFDLGFFLTHLLLKTALHRRTPVATEMLGLIDRFRDRYRLRLISPRRGLPGREAGGEGGISNRGFAISNFEIPDSKSPIRNPLPDVVSPIIPELSLLLLERRTVPHLAGCLLARLDGKSPVDYLSDESTRSLVRAFARSLFLEPPRDLDETLTRFVTQVLPPFGT